MGLDSSVGIAAGYGLDGPGIESQRGARFSASLQTGPEVHPASYTTGTRSVPGLLPGLGVNHPPPSSAEVKEGVEVCLYSNSEPSWSVIGLNLPLTSSLLLYVYCNIHLSPCM